MFLLFARYYFSKGYLLKLLALWINSLGLKYFVLVKPCIFLDYWSMILSLIYLSSAFFLYISRIYPSKRFFDYSGNLWSFVGEIPESLSIYYLARSPGLFAVWMVLTETKLSVSSRLCALLTRIAGLVCFFRSFWLPTLDTLCVFYTYSSF